MNKYKNTIVQIYASDVTTNLYSNTSIAAVRRSASVDTIGEDASPKNAVTKGLVASDRTTNIATPRGITEDSFKMMLDKFKNQAFKDFAARHQVNYLHQNLCKLV